MLRQEFAATSPTRSLGDGNAFYGRWVRVAIVTECFLPAVNGVTGTVSRIVEHLERRGHDCVLVAPGAGPSEHSRSHVERVPGVRLPFYRDLAVARPGAAVDAILRNSAPDLVHLAAPAVLGAMAGAAARRAGIPVVATYQTDLAGFASRYHLGVARGAIWSWLRHVHAHADLTLAPSTLAIWELERHGIAPVKRWARGVDAARFSRDHRSSLLRRRLAPGGEVIVGYVGRLAHEKRVELLAPALDIPNARVVIVGDGPARRRLERRLPGATFLGFLFGEALSQAVASLDIFVHTGADETFCQAVQEALASGVPVVTAAAGGPLDLVRHGENGYLFPPDRPDLLRGAVAALVDDRRRRHRMSRAASVSVAGRGWERIGDELISHYAHVVGETGAAAERAA